MELRLLEDKQKLKCGGIWYNDILHKNSICLLEWFGHFWCILKLIMLVCHLGVWWELMAWRTPRWGDFYMEHGHVGWGTRACVKSWNCAWGTRACLKLGLLLWRRHGRVSARHGRVSIRWWLREKENNTAVCHETWPCRFRVFGKWKSINRPFILF